MEITIESFRNFTKDRRNKAIMLFWILMFLTGAFAVLKIMGRV